MEPEKKKLNFYIIREVVCTFALIIFFGHFAIRWGAYLTHTYSTSVLLFVIYELIIVVLLVIRNLPRDVSVSFYDWGIAVGGTLMPLLYTQATAPLEHPFFLLFQIAGSILSFAGILSLYTSFGIVAANRGVRTTGIYRFIRHPLYSGYFFAQAGFVIQNFSPLNLAVFTTFTVLQFLRIRAEEAFLGRDPAYQAYREKVRWRLIPYIW